MILVNLESFWRCKNTKIIRKHSSKPPKFSRLRRAILSTVLYPQINRGTQCRSTYKILLTLSCAFLHLRKLRSASSGPQTILRIVEARSYTPENSENRIRAVYKSFCEQQTRLPTIEKTPRVAHVRRVNHFANGRSGFLHSLKLHEPRSRGMQNNLWNRTSLLSALQARAEEHRTRKNIAQKPAAGGKNHYFRRFSTIFLRRSFV